MFRLTRPLAQALKRTTGITGLAVHPNPLPELTKTYESTLSVLSGIPPSSVYRQGVEALTLRKLKIVQAAEGNVSLVEKQLDEGQIEESLDIASDELKLAAKMVEWKASLNFTTRFQDRQPFSLRPAASNMDSLIPFTTSGSLVDCVDRKMLVILRDGRKLHGVLRSYDQFGGSLRAYSRCTVDTCPSANLVLEDTVERIYHGNAFAESWRGLYLIRGENVVLLGEIDLDREDDIPLRQVDWHLLEPYHKNDTEAKKQREEAKSQILYEQKGFCKEGGEGDGY
ncbi:hypothetical protein H0H81_002453 [Sphagnurus paluster]|uniref:U6 snRNA-associated Sm-like protein LSm1 n=1 Tax=Sphagnurus paluster TaxID=117069 RepID=A0A9P7GR39_9AGAR|nr:hypothetical protein H0H81_002453 [Sphagnurus paluster]